MNEPIKKRIPFAGEGWRFPFTRRILLHYSIDGEKLLCKNEYGYIASMKRTYLGDHYLKCDKCKIKLEKLELKAIANALTAKDSLAQQTNRLMAGCSIEEKEGKNHG
jgi:hypothetical protein